LIEASFYGATGARKNAWARRGKEKMMELACRHYPEFSRRLAALLIDLLILEVAISVIIFFPGAILSFFGKSKVPVMPLTSTLSYLLFLLYFTLMESSYKQATIGKMFLGITVADAKGGKISFNKAVLRNIGKYIPLFVLVAFAWVTSCLGKTLEGAELLILIPILFGVLWYGPMWFSPRRQTTHDMMADSVVVSYS
jgi:uncharacterized RDD family membrane protein YckC